AVEIEAALTEKRVPAPEPLFQVYPRLSESAVKEIGHKDAQEAENRKGGRLFLLPFLCLLCLFVAQALEIIWANETRSPSGSIATANLIPSPSRCVGGMTKRMPLACSSW